MQGFRRKNGTLTCKFEPEEVAILLSLLDQLTELLSDPALGNLISPPPGLARAPGETEDELFARLEADFTVELEAADFGHDPEIDPVLRRLFPDAYPDDPAAAFDFRRYTQPEQRDAKVAGATTVIGDLRRQKNGGRCEVPDDHVTAWLTTLTNVRIALAVRLDITDANSADLLAELRDDDPRTWVFSIYEWVGWVQESMLDCLS